MMKILYSRIGIYMWFNWLNLANEITALIQYYNNRWEKWNWCLWQKSICVLNTDGCLTALLIAHVESSKTSKTFAMESLFCGLLIFGGSRQRACDLSMHHEAEPEMGFWYTMP